jgi:hypothetical protein
MAGGGQASNAPRNVSQRRVKRVDNNKPVLSDSRTVATWGSLYRPLDFDSFEIRLLKLRSAVGMEAGVACSLEYASLINPPDYIALSYCWGNATKTRKIYIMRWGDIEVTQNLYEALVNVFHMKQSRRSKSPGHQPRCNVLLWVDALCINQEDPVERSQQVRQMRQIYSRASEVVSWIPCGSEQAVDYFVRNGFHGEGIETEVQLPSRKRTNGVPVEGSDN